MEMGNVEPLLYLYGHVDLFLLIFVRFLAFFIILPVFSGQNIPAMARISVTLGLTMLVFFAGNATVPPYPHNLYGFFLLVLQEFVTGFILGFVVYLIFSVFYFVGQLVDYQIGFSMISVYDPVSQIQVPITGNFYYLIMCVFFIQTGMLSNFIAAVFESYQLIPLGQAVIFGNEKLIPYIIDAVVTYITMGVKIALPVVGTIIVVDIVLGILIKAVPQMNIFVVGMPIKLLIGLVVIYFTLPLYSDVFNLVLNDAWKYFVNILKGMTGNGT